MPDSTEPTSREGRGLGHHPAFTQAAGLHGGGGTGPAHRPGPDAGPLLWCKGAMDWVGGASVAPCYSQGISKGHSEGMSKGHTEGTSKGYSQDISKSYSQGISKSHNEGISKSYSQGISKHYPEPLVGPILLQPRTVEALSNP